MRILCVTSVKNEAPFLVEWVAHCQSIGVTDFLVFSNDCEDGTHEMLRALHEAGIIEHCPQTVEEGESPQWQALRAAWKHQLRKDCDWAMVCDVDEFMNVHIGEGTLPELIAAVPEDTDGILLPWRLFGSAGQVVFEDRPVTEQFTASMEAACSFPFAATLFKSLIRTSGPFNQFGVHRPKQKGPEKAGLPVWVNGSGEKMPTSFAQNQQRLSLYGLPNGRQLVECNHYSLKSAESFIVKRARGLPNHSDKDIDLAYWVERNFNTVENTSISRTDERRTRHKNMLFTTANLRRLHDAGVAWHRAKFLELMQSEADHKIFGQILVAGDSKSVSPKIAQQIVAWYQGIHRQKMQAKQKP